MPTVRPDLLEDADLPAPFGRYTLLSLLGEGGMARVFRAELQGPSGFRKRAAVKIIHATVAKKSEKLRRALINEARLGGLLQHPNIVDTYEFGEEAGLPFIAMELVRGVGLDVMLELMRPIPPAQAIEIALQICAGLDHAHNLEDDDGEPVLIVHRDLKPSNVLLSKDGLVKVMDFGIAKAATNTYNTTETGMTKGTPAYMSPEQAEGVPLDGRSDIFALGALLYEMVTGERLFRGENMVQVLMAVLRVEGLLAEEQRWEWLDATVPGLRAVVTRCLRKNRDDRYRDCAALERDLKQLAKELPEPRLLKETVRGLMAEHGLGGGDGSSSVRVAGAVGTSGSSIGSPAAARGPGTPSTPARVATDVGPTRAQLPATPAAVPATEVPPALVQPPATPAAVAAVDAPAGTLWEGAEAQRPRRSAALLIALGLLLLGAVAGLGYFLGASGPGEVAPPEPSPAAVAVAPADALSEPVEVAPPPAAAPAPTPAAAPTRKPAAPEAAEAAAPTPAPVRPAAETPTPSPREATPARTKERTKERARSAGEVREAPRKKPKRRGPAFDPDDPNLVVEHARVTVKDNGDETWSVRYAARVRGGRDARATVRFNPPGASWVEKKMRSKDDVTFVQSVVYRKKNLGKTYWYIEVVRPDGTRAGWGSAGEKKKFVVDDD